MTEREDFLRTIQTSVEGTPYVVTETDRGFDLTLDIVDARWFGPYHREGLHRVHTHDVDVLGNGACTFTDDSRTVERQAGVPPRREDRLYFAMFGGAGAIVTMIILAVLALST